MDKIIARQIVLAQVASDGGKGIKTIRHISKSSFQDWKEGYGSKDQHIINAIMLINKSRGKSAFKYAVQNGGFSWLVYFEITINGELYQISFHTFNPKIGRFMWHKSHKRFIHMKWDEKCSRTTAVAIARNYGIGNVRGYEI